MVEERGGKVGSMDARYCIDNGAMIAYSGYLKSQTPDCYSSLKVKPNPSLTI